MDRARLYLVENPYVFSGIKSSYEESHFSAIGVPFDITTSFRPGSRFGPASIRHISSEVETLSLNSNLDIEEVPISDIGDIAVTLNVEEALKRVETVSKEVNEDSKIPLLLGGEHTLTLGAVRGLRPDLLVCFDAHFDYREEYPQGIRFSYATVMRRISEEVCGVVHVGVRATCREEVEYAHDKTFITSVGAIEKPLEASKRLRDMVERAERVYVSVDLDALDPAYAPGVANPEACGLSTLHLIRFLEEVIDENIVGLDIVELNPLLDPSGASAAAATRIAFEAIAFSARRKGFLPP